LKDDQLWPGASALLDIGRRVAERIKRANQEHHNPILPGLILNFFQRRGEPHFAEPHLDV
jgi:hypothetical protein